MYLVLIDADPLAYRAVHSKDNNGISSLCKKVDELFQEVFEGIREKTGNDFRYKAFLTGQGNFRYDVDKNYKAQRPEKPLYLGLVREYIVNNYEAVVTEGEEADDAIAIEATQTPHQPIIVSIDKDFKQVPCLIYNPTRKEWHNPDEQSALRFFYTQVLTGDAVDNIKGVWKVGPKGADKLLEGATTEEEMWKRCLDAYEGDYDRAVMNGKLLWLRREKGQMWEPPNLGATAQV